MNRPVAVSLFVVVSLAFCTGGVACGDDDPAPTPAAAGGSTSSVPDETGLIYQGGATDEAFRAVAGVAPIVDATKGPTITAPASDGEILPRTTPTTFTWSATVARRSPREPSMLDELRKVIGPLRSAHAHGDPTTGTVYLLTIAAADGRELRVFTTATSYTPTQAEWDAIVALGGALSARVIGAAVEDNKLRSGGGPFVAGAARVFSVAP